MVGQEQAKGINIIKAKVDKTQENRQWECESCVKWMQQVNPKGV